MIDIQSLKLRLPPATISEKTNVSDPILAFTDTTTQRSLQYYGINNQLSIFKTNLSDPRFAQCTHEIREIPIMIGQFLWKPQLIFKMVNAASCFPEKSLPHIRMEQGIM